MAPWSTRRGSHSHSHSSSSDLISRIHHSALHTPTTLSPAHGNRFDISFSNAHDGADSSDSDAEFVHNPSSLSASASSHARPPSKSRHSRSMSQPFPSLFSSKKKRQSSVGAPLPQDLGFADDDNTTTTTNMPLRKGIPTRSSHTRGGPQQGSKDFATGNCMTCGSLVRWPRDLSVFKCTICMTVNDMEPLGVDAQSHTRRDATRPPPPRGNAIPETHVVA